MLSSVWILIQASYKHFHASEQQVKPSLGVSANWRYVWVPWRISSDGVATALTLISRTGLETNR